MIRFGLIGCGRISDSHFKAVESIDTAEIVSCCDIVTEKAKEKAEQYKIGSYYSDYKKMIETEKLDAVIVCTPSGLHPEIGIAASEKKLHVVTEKPMAIDLESADALIQSCDKNKVKLFVVKQNRLNTTMQLLKNALDKNRFGHIYLVQSNVFWQRPQSYYDQAKWRGTWEFDGGAFMNQASHYVDALYWLIGPVDHVMAETATMARKIETEDTGSAILKFRNGVIGTINVTLLTYPKNYEGSITVLGEKGTVKIGGIAVNRIEKWEFEDYDDDDRIVTESNYQPPNVYGFGHLPYYINVVKTLEGKAVPDIDGRDGRKSLEIIRAIYLSAKQGKKIALPLK
ncbi:MAG TPA: Gfo/Idh/MocA family oxidoreductase [Clostridiales bacterium]|jgi:UDP-N-acetyl-2-amino-2-deoxyglucuronate dehydrogenase|nr:Gfo/Idh/MocA family oxidoreductase [Clostridiales bacterium]HQP70594.1 Gfo/Idh/MocA family oxidoreductase [Clostridiales bacterium]